MHVNATLRRHLPGIGLSLITEWEGAPLSRTSDICTVIQVGNNRVQNVLTIFLRSAVELETFGDPVS